MGLIFRCAAPPLNGPSNFYKYSGALHRVHSQFVLRCAIDFELLKRGVYNRNVCQINSINHFYRCSAP